MRTVGTNGVLHRRSSDCTSAYVRSIEWARPVPHTFDALPKQSGYSSLGVHEMVRSASDKNLERYNQLLLVFAGALLCVLADITIQMASGRNSRPINVGDQAISFALYAVMTGFAIWIVRGRRALWVCIGTCLLLLTFLRLNLQEKWIGDETFLSVSLFLSRSLLLSFSVGLLPLALHHLKDRK